MKASIPPLKRKVPPAARSARCRPRERESHDRQHAWNSFGKHGENRRNGCAQNRSHGCVQAHVPRRERFIEKRQTEAAERTCGQGPDCAAGIGKSGMGADGDREHQDQAAAVRQAVMRNGSERREANPPRKSLVPQQKTEINP